MCTLGKGTQCRPPKSLRPVLLNMFQIHAIGMVLVERVLLKSVSESSNIWCLMVIMTDVSHCVVLVFDCSGQCSCSFVSRPNWRWRAMLPSCRGDLGVALPCACRGLHLNPTSERDSLCVFFSFLGHTENGKQSRQASLLCLFLGLIFTGFTYGLLQASRPCWVLGSNICTWTSLPFVFSLFIFMLILTRRYFIPIDF